MMSLEAATVFAAFEATAEKYPSNAFLVIPASACRSSYAEGELAYTYAEALAKVATLRDMYRAVGLQAGQRVAILLENRSAYFFHWFALNALGVSVVPINPDYRSAELEYLLEHSEAVLAVAIAARVGDLQAAADSAGRGIRVVSDDQVPRALPKLASPASAQTLGRKTQCALLYTSGTTGRPKGCLLSNDYFLPIAIPYLTPRPPIQLL